MTTIPIDPGVFLFLCLVVAALLAVILTLVYLIYQRVDQIHDNILLMIDEGDDDDDDDDDGHDDQTDDDSWWRCRKASRRTPPNRSN